jgi:hypothetical protein
MNIENLDTTHDLADLLEGVAAVLRKMPATAVRDAQLKGFKGVIEAEPESENPRGNLSEQVSSLAAEMTDLDRAGAETRLASLTVSSIRDLSSIFQIRIPSKSTKRDAIDLVLSQLFDVPAGQELIRTYHKRKLESTSVNN